MPEFNLRRLVRQVVDEHPHIADPHEFTPLVLERVGDGDLREALRQCLGVVIREDFRARRSSFRPFVPEAETDLSRVLAAVASSSEGSSVTVSPSSAVMQERPSGPSGRSVPSRPVRSKASMVRGYARRWLDDQRLRTSSGWKAIGDCSFEELRDVAAARRVNAHRNLAMADVLDRLAREVRDAGVSSVRALPEEVLNSFEGVDISDSES